MNIIIIIMIKCFISIYFQSIMFTMKYEWSTKFALKIWKKLQLGIILSQKTLLH